MELAWPTYLTTVHFSLLICNNGIRTAHALHAIVWIKWNTECKYSNTSIEAGCILYGVIQDLLDVLPAFKIAKVKTGT